MNFNSVNFDLTNRQSGKTTRMVEWLKRATNRIMLVMNRSTRNNIIGRFNLETSEQLRILTYDEFLSEDVKLATPKVINSNEIVAHWHIRIDDAEQFLNNLMREHVLDGISMSISDTAEGEQWP